MVISLFPVEYYYTFYINQILFMHFEIGLFSKRSHYHITEDYHNTISYINLCILLVYFYFLLRF